mmetsp:Transcript_31554/g.75361  ORF Transcript_31554/g.75361 Transcript_31554/m.75361 type:complete len:114 (+) Transcript_31554:835-1176(+)
MGQTIGRITVKGDVLPFTLLPGSLVITLKQSLEEVAESFGVTENELQQIVRISLQEYLSIRASDEATASLFRLLSAGGPESNGLVDSFELLATLCVLSGAQWMEKIEFVSLLD